jgi:hypothetical protein
MASVELTTEQVVDLVRQLPVDRKREVLLALAVDAQSGRATRLAYAEDQLRRLCAKRGLNWDAMSNDEREALADDLVHEGRS